MSKKGGVLINLFWKFAERMAAQVVTLLVSIILARLLTPEDYGLISIVTIFITLANVLVSDGFGNALIQKKDADALDFSTVLYFNIAFSLGLYLLLYVTAPMIAEFYGAGYELLTPVLRVLGLRIIISGVNSVQQAYVSRKMIFQQFFWSTLIATVISAVIGIAMAYAGFGVWALVAQYLTNTTVATVTLAITMKKMPLLAFSLARLRSMLGFGTKVLSTKLLITGFEELRALIIGKLYSSNDLAYYDKGRQFPQVIVANINTSISAVLFPKMSSEQDNVERIKQTTRNSIRFSSYIMAPMMMGLAAVATPFVRLVLTDKWLPCVPLLQLSCIFYLFQPIHTANMQAIKAMGRGDIYFKLEVIKKAIELVVLFAVMWISVDAIVISMAVLAALFTVVNAWPNRELISYSFTEQMADILPSLLMAMTMAVCVYLIGYLPLGLLTMLVLQVLAGAIVYIVLSAVTRNEEFQYLWSMVKAVLKRKKL